MNSIEGRWGPGSWSGGQGPGGGGRRCARDRDRSRRARISKVQKDSGGCSNGEGLNGKLSGVWLKDCDLESGSKAIPEMAFSVHPYLSVPQFLVEKNSCLLSHP